MILEQNNFIINMLLLDYENKITLTNINDRINMFTSNNSSPVLGNDNMKYKIMFENLEIPNNTKFVLFQIVLKNEDEFYNPYLFVPVKNENKSDYQECIGRALSYNLYENKFNHIWMYFTRKDIDKILDDFEPLTNQIDAKEYFKEYKGLCI